MKMLKSVSPVPAGTVEPLLLPEKARHCRTLPGASGNALGPFTAGQTVKIITEVSNSIATRTTAPPRPEPS